MPRVVRAVRWFSFFFFNDTATTEIYTLSLHDALPISLAPAAHRARLARHVPRGGDHTAAATRRGGGRPNRMRTPLNSSHSQEAYAVFCLKKKKPAAFAISQATAYR